MTRIVVWSTLVLIEYDEVPVFFLHRLRGKRGFIPPRSRRCKGRVCFIHVTGKLGRRNSMKTPEPEDLPVIGNLHLCYERWQSVGLFHKISIFCSNCEGTEQLRLVIYPRAPIVKVNDSAFFIYNSSATISTQCCFTNGAS